MEIFDNVILSNVQNDFGLMPFSTIWYISKQDKEYTVCCTHYSKSIFTCQQLTYHVQSNDAAKLF